MNYQCMDCDLFIYFNLQILQICYSLCLELGSQHTYLNSAKALRQTKREFLVIGFHSSKVLGLGWQGRCASM